MLQGKWSKRKGKAQEDVDGSGGRRDEEGGFDERRCTKLFKRKKIRQEIKTSGHLLGSPRIKIGIMMMTRKNRELKTRFLTKIFKQV